MSADAVEVIPPDQYQRRCRHLLTVDECETCSAKVAPVTRALQSLDTQELQVKPARDAHGRLLPGHTANKFGGRPKKIREIEAMLNKEHRNVEGMREIFARLRALAMGEVVLVPVFTDGGEVTVRAELKADSRFMQLYLDRLLGPAKAFDDAMDLTDAPQAVLEYLAKKVGR